MTFDPTARPTAFTSAHVEKVITRPYVPTEAEHAAIEFRMRAWCWFRRLRVAW